MLRRIITEEIAGFMIWIIEITAQVFFENDRAKAFRELNERKLWHFYIDNFEKKRNLSLAGAIAELKESLEYKSVFPLIVNAINDDDAQFVKSIVLKIATKYNWNYSITLDRFYNSSVCRSLSDARIGISAFSLEEVLDLFAHEYPVGE